MPEKWGLSGELPFDLEMTAPPRDLAPAVNTFFVANIGPGTIAERMPAYSAQLLVFVSGAMVLRPGTAGAERLEGAAFTAPFLKAQPVAIEGPALVVGASLTPLGWQRLSNLPVDVVHNCSVPAKEVLAPDRLRALEEAARDCRSGKVGSESVRAALGEAAGQPNHVVPTGHEAFIDTITRWLANDLNPSVATLYRETRFSERTAQRICRRFFGVPPSRLAKRYRAIRAAMLLANPQLPQAIRDEIRDAYFDQAHLIRDIRRYTGRTPKMLGAESLFEESFDPKAHGEGARILREAATANSSQD